MSDDGKFLTVRLHANGQGYDLESNMTVIEMYGALHAVEVDLRYGQLTQASRAAVDKEASGE